MTESLRRVFAIVRHELRLIRVQWVLYVSGILMPLVVVVFVRPLFRHTLSAGEGYRGVNGAEQAVPGMAVMFGFFMVGVVAFTFLREHGFGTWERLRVTPTRPAEVMIGKLLPFMGMLLLQQALLFSIGGLVFDLKVTGSLIALAVVIVALSVCLMAFAVAVVALAGSMQQVNMIQTLGAMLFAGVGGALTPSALLPSWIAAVSPAIPSYWAMRGYRAVILDSGDVGTVVLPAAVLAAFALGLFVIAAVRFRFEESKPYWL